MKGYGTKTFGQLNAERYEMIYEDLMLEETLDSVETLAELAGGGKVLELANRSGGSPACRPWPVCTRQRGI